MSRLYLPHVRTFIALACMVMCSKLRRVHSSTHYHFTDQHVGVPMSDHKTSTERKAREELWNSQRSSLCISVSSPEIKLVLCNVSLKSTPCISAGSYRLINSWQKKLNESPGCHHLLFTRLGRWRLEGSFLIDRFAKDVPKLGGTRTPLTSHIMVQQNHIKKETTITKVNLGGCVNTEGPLHPLWPPCVMQHLIWGTGCVSNLLTRTNDDK